MRITQINLGAFNAVQYMYYNIAYITAVTPVYLNIASYLSRLKIRGNVDDISLATSHWAIAWRQRFYFHHNSMFAIYIIFQLIEYS